LTREDAFFLTSLRERLSEKLTAVSDDLDYGLIHADIIRENVLVSESGIAIIDFDDCGFGWRLFDIATSLLRNRGEPHYPLIRRSLLEGYRSKRPLGEETLAHLPLFLLLRSLTYIGWVSARPEMPAAADRLQRFLADARQLTLELEDRK
jgi:Ser/Thr protein kinase RdoA (MazF antagonist)